jgi:hypothetical protein
MRLRISILTVLFGLFSLSAGAQTVQSDYEIQKSFKKQYAKYQDRVEVISSPDSAQVLIASIKEFDQQYSEHVELLNKALYPDTYSQRMEELKRSSVVAMNRVQTITQQETKLAEMKTELNTYEQDLEQLTRQSDSLKQAMQKSIQSEKELSAMVRQYRQNLEKRDELILSFIDSMVVAYQQMDLQSLQDLENLDKKLRIEQENNALGMIHNISAENLEILRSNSDRLRLQDYMRMAEMHQQFETMWTRLGDKIQQVYDGENTEQLAKQIKTNIDEWNTLLKAKTFAVLRDSLAESNIAISEFETSDELYSSLNTYLDSKIKQSREKSSQAIRDEFTKFQRFWNQVEMRWSSNLANTGIISTNQMAALNEKVDTWAANAQPRKSNSILVYLLGGTVLLAVALGVMLIRERKNRNKLVD